jgi:PIN domain nuclease of toxin-antitoxin system
MEHGYRELALSGDHALGIEALPPLHKDPFDRMLIAQARSEAMTLLTSDKAVAKYPGLIQRV